MIDRHRIEDFLRANGVPASAKEEEIRSVLISARWNDDEVDTAMTVLKENTENKERRIDTLHKVFLTDDRLNHNEINSLLGIDVEITTDDMDDIEKKRLSFGRYNKLVAIILAIIFAVCGMAYIMYLDGAGPFHQSLLLNNEE